MKRKLISCILSLLLVLVFSGCEEEKELVIVEEESYSNYSLTSAKRTDLKKTASVITKYQQKVTEDLSFSLDGYRIKKYYVAIGDKVQKGDLLAELELSNLNEVIEEIDNTISSAKLELDFVIKQKELRLSQAERMLEKSEIDELGYERELYIISEEYDGIISEYEDLIYYEQVRRDYYGKQLEGGRLYATMDGIVTFVRSWSRWGSYSVSGQKVVSISDNDICAFNSTDYEYAKYFKENEHYFLDVNGEKKETVFHLSKKDKMLVFELLEDDLELVIGTKGTYSIVLSEKKDALCISKNALHKADDKYYVYVLGDDNVRSIRYVITGLEGDREVEIVSGIDENDILVLR
ncbi:MAG: efflux RND transporter periplasmic adaptor subunit [Lachnospiraceae bacterium]|nr:efflux RND transporter periplasmic adaptor subunit [Lachnospiraceae bacterium]